MNIGYADNFWGYVPPCYYDGETLSLQDFEQEIIAEYREQAVDELRDMMANGDMDEQPITDELIAELALEIAYGESDTPQRRFNAIYNSL